MKMSFDPRLLMLEGDCCHFYFSYCMLINCLEIVETKKEENMKNKTISSLIDTKFLVGNQIAINLLFSFFERILGSIITQNLLNLIFMNTEVRAYVIAPTLAFYLFC